MSVMCFSLFIFYQEEIKKRASSFFQNDLNPHLLPGKFILCFQIYSRNSKIYGSKHRVLPQVFEDRTPPPPPPSSDIIFHECTLCHRKMLTSVELPSLS